MTDRAEQLRAASARSRKARREAGLEPHEIWCTRQEWAERVKPLLATLSAARAPQNAPKQLEN